MSGVTLIIPCGPDNCGSDEVFYTYYNESNAGQLLKNMSSTVLEIETKFYQNGNKIICKKSGCGSYCYELNIQCMCHCPVCLSVCLSVYLCTYIIKSHSFHTLTSHS